MEPRALYLWRYRTRNLNKHARNRCRGLHLATKDWSRLIDEIREGFLDKNLTQMKLPAAAPSPIIQEFADLWADERGVSVFLESLTFQYRHERERLFEVENRGLESSVRLSRESFDELSFWMDCLSV